MKKSRTIFHVDVNSAYLSWEAAHRIAHHGSSFDLREIPSIIGGNKDTRNGIVLAKSIPAKQYNIQTGEVVWQARQKCPNLYVAPPNYNLYDSCSQAFIHILKEYAIVEQYSIDEAYMDLTGMENIWGDSYDLANQIKDRIFHELGFTVNIGISNNKLLAKMASDFKKPNYVHVLYQNEIASKMWKLPVSDLFFVGRSTSRKLNLLGIRTIGDLANSDLNVLKRHLNKHGEIIWSFANGIDISDVLPESIPNKGYGNSMTIPFDVSDRDMAKLILLSLCETVAARLRADHVKAGTISIGIKDIDFAYKSHQTVLNDATNCTSEIHAISCRLFDELWNQNPIRHLGVHTSKVSKDECRQIGMFGTNYEKQEYSDAAVDKVRLRYGNDSIKRASFIHSSIYHMSGGISNDKKSVDYSEIAMNGKDGFDGFWA